jgi:hypothetical protein
MCGKPTQSEIQRARVEEEAVRREPRPRGPWENTKPRGNGPLERRDLERSEEKLAALMGR